MPLVKYKTVTIPERASSISSSNTLLDRFDSMSSNGLSLLSYLLQYDYKRRWSASQALKSNYFTENPLPSSPDDMPKFPTHSFTNE